jgi:hypothetical protein
MTTDLIRDVLRYPDDDQLPDLAEVTARAHRIRRKRRTATLLVGVLAAAGIGAGATVAASRPGSGAATVLPAEGPTDTDAATSTASLAPDPAPGDADTVIKAAAGEKVDMGHGWTVWLQDGAVCRSSPADTGPGRQQPFGCRSVSDGNIGGMNAQVSGSPEGTMVSAVVPYDAARVVVRAGSRAADAQLLRFRGVHGWTFYWAWLPGQATSPTVAAYDTDGVLIGLLES